MKNIISIVNFKPSCTEVKMNNSLGFGEVMYLTNNANEAVRKPLLIGACLSIKIGNGYCDRNCVNKSSKIPFSWMTQTQPCWQAVLHEPTAINPTHPLYIPLLSADLPHKMQHLMSLIIYQVGSLYLSVFYDPASLLGFVGKLLLRRHPLLNHPLYKANTYDKRHVVWGNSWIACTSVLFFVTLKKNVLWWEIFKSYFSLFTIVLCET